MKIQAESRRDEFLTVYAKRWQASKWPRQLHTRVSAQHVDVRAWQTYAIYCGELHIESIWAVLVSWLK